MGSKNSWRFNFVELDSSVNLRTDAGTIKGYIGVRAPKGETSPYYFPKGNVEPLYAYIGLPTADYPDLFEAEAFIREYGCYVSAPAGSSKSYPSYVGGTYLTSAGDFNFYNVTDKGSIDYTKKVEISKNNIEIKVKATAPSENNIGQDNNYAIVIKDIDSETWSKIKQFSIEYPGNAKAGIEAGTYYFNIDKTNGKVFCEVDGESAPVNSGVWFTLSNNNKAIVLGGSDWLRGQVVGDSDASPYDEMPATTSQNLYTHKDIPLLSVNTLCDNIESFCASSTDSDNVWTEIKNSIESENPFGYLNTEFKVTKDNGDFTIYATGNALINAKDGINWLLDVKNDTFAYINQKGQTEKKTEVVIENIGYDKYLYDIGANAVIVTDTKTAPAFNADYAKANSQNVFICIKESDAMSAESMKAGAAVNSVKVYYCLDGAYYDVTDDFATKEFLILDVYKDNSKLPSHALKHNIIKVDDVSYILHEDDKDHLKRVDNNFNTITFSVAEEVYPGKMTKGGTFTGSLSVTGKDAFGSNIYFPKVLSADDFSFVEITPIKDFTSMVDNKGIFTGTRIVDDKLNTFDGKELVANKKIILKGQRYVSHLVDENIKNGLQGGAWNDKFTPIIKEAWNEAFDNQYDDVYTFMDPTGNSDIQTIQASLVETHKLAVTISKKVLTPAEVANPDKIKVIGRNRKCTQYAGEFEYFDSWTGQTTYITPIGDVGAMFCRIIENRLGGKAPAWYNENNLGGQLPRAVEKSRWNFSETATKIMDEKGINPIIFNAEEGLMCVSSKTLQDPNTGGDWSEIGHVLAFLLCIREIRDNVMRPQIKKPIDDEHMDAAQRKLTSILEKRTIGSKKIWREALSNVRGVNNDTTMAQRNFMIKVKVKVTTFADYVTLEFENVDQATNINF